MSSLINISIVLELERENEPREWAVRNQVSNIEGVKQKIIVSGKQELDRNDGIAKEFSTCSYTFYLSSSLEHYHWLAVLSSSSHRAKRSFEL